ncbi:MAG: permease [Paludibacteraceae bacterium]|nr:permease [Paludibacteraceae bacterium]
MIQQFADWLIFDIIGLDATSRLGESINFFVYDSIKIIILLFGISVVMGIINAYFPIERLRNYLSTHKMYGFQYLLASIFGAITPFCSCSSIPLFIGFVKGGIPLGVTFAFLITSPLVNEVAVAMFLGTFGVKVTAIYVACGILLGMIGGVLLGKMNLERYLSPWIIQMQKMQMEADDAYESNHLTFMQRLPGIIKDALGIVKGVLLYVIIGIAIGAGIHGYVPEGFFTEFMQKAGIFGVPASVIIAIPMYSNAAGIVPVVEVFVAKGIPLGTALSFMMSVVGLSLPEATMLKKIMTWKLIGIFFGTVALMIMMLGWTFNIIL